MRRRTKLGLAVIAAAVYCIALAPSVQAADGVHSLTHTNGKWTLTLTTPDPWEVKLITPAPQEIICGQNYGNPCKGTVFTFTSQADCVTAQIDWSGEHNSSDPTACKDTPSWPTTPPTSTPSSPSAEPSSTPSTEPSPSTSPTTTPTVTPSPSTSPSPEQTATPSPSPSETTAPSPSPSPSQGIGTPEFPPTPTEEPQPTPHPTSTPTASSPSSDTPSIESPKSPVSGAPMSPERRDTLAVTGPSNDSVLFGFAGCILLLVGAAGIWITREER